MTILFITALFLTTGTLYGKPSVNTLLEKIDENQSLTTDITARMTFLQVRPVQGTNRYEMLYYRRDKDDAFLLLMLAPSVEKGNGYLKTGDNFWMYRKNTRTFQHIARDENISGTDIKSGDLEERKYTELFKPALGENGKEVLEEEMLGNIKTWKFKVTAKVKDVTYPLQEIWVDQTYFLPRKINNYSRSGTLMVTQFFKNYQKIKDKYIAKIGYSRDMFEKGNWTVFRIKEISTSAISDEIFTKAYLENLSR